MQHSRIKNSGPGSPGRRVLASALALVLFPAVPVSAVTFLTPWSVTQLQQNGAPAAIVVADAFPSVGSLSVDMGTTSLTNARSFVQASRHFRVAPGGEMIGISHAFTTFLRNSELDVTIDIRPANAFVVPRRKRRGNAHGQTFTLSELYKSTLPAGDYKIIITINYKNDGQNPAWSNSSPHSFSIASL